MHRNLQALQPGSSHSTERSPGTNNQAHDRRRYVRITLQSEHSGAARACERRVADWRRRCIINPAFRDAWARLLAKVGA